MNNTRIGLELARARRKAGLSQTDVAKRMGTTQSSVSRAEGGWIAPSPDFLERYARAVGRTVTIRYGEPELPVDREALRARVRNVIDDYTFNPWDRSPTPGEARSLEADGLTRERFERDATA